MVFCRLIFKKIRELFSHVEKILKLYDILKYIGSSEFSGELVLKGGTAINLFLLNLPRLSVDIDLDFNLNANLDEMLKRREKIDMLIFSNNKRNFNPCSS